MTDDAPFGTSDPRVVLGAFAVIEDGSERVLLSHRRDMDLWNMPGGIVEAGETPWAAVLREVAEETGLDVAAESLTGIYCKRYGGRRVRLPMLRALRRTRADIGS